jgi:16S rRNA (guanine1207-N2)-methyltransferase
MACRAQSIEDRERSGKIASLSATPSNKECTHCDIGNLITAFRWSSKRPFSREIDVRNVDPWYKATYLYKGQGLQIALDVPYDVFSTLQIDDGTLLLLDNLAPESPQRILDMGCGYGALGLPLAARFPLATVEMVDRDLLAVEWSLKNARKNNLAQALPYPSLGFANLPSSTEPYDWILCNVPARIGMPFIKDLFLSGSKKLKATGEIRVVIINDLRPTLESLRDEVGFSIEEVIKGPRHSVYRMKAPSSSPATPSPTFEELYLRDEVVVSNLRLKRPFDISGDSHRLEKSLPVLFDALPKKAPARLFNFRCSYGVLPLLARKRYPDAAVVAWDRDLLATTFCRANAESLRLAENLDIRSAADLRSAVKSDETFDFCFGEFFPSVGKNVFEFELSCLQQSLTPQGQALILCPEKSYREWLQPYAAKEKFTLHPLITRDHYTVLRLSR